MTAFFTVVGVIASMLFVTAVVMGIYLEASDLIREFRVHRAAITNLEKKVDEIAKLEMEQ